MPTRSVRSPAPRSAQSAPAKLHTASPPEADSHGSGDMQPGERGANEQAHAVEVGLSQLSRAGLLADAKPEDLSSRCRRVSR